VACTLNVLESAGYVKSEGVIVLLYIRAGSRVERLRNVMISAGDGHLTRNEIVLAPSQMNG